MIIYNNLFLTGIACTGEARPACDCLLLLFQLVAQVRNSKRINKEDFYFERLGLMTCLWGGGIVYYPRFIFLAE